MFKYLKHVPQEVEKFPVSLFSFYADFSFKTKKQKQHILPSFYVLKIGINEKWRILRK